MTVVSIIIPVRDTAPYLIECIDSIVEQDFKHWELIAVNDASSDESPDILQRYSEKDDRIKVLDNPNPGLIKALQLGYKNSTGQLITRMDSDDKMPENKLSLLVESWNKYGKGTIITGGVEYFSQDIELGDGFKRYSDWLNDVMRDSSFKSQLYKECVIPSCCWLIHREDFERINGFEPDTVPEDYDLCFRFIHGNLNIIALNETLHYWRDRPDRISRTREEYSDNRFFELKLHYFLKHDNNKDRPLVIWGAGRNGKDLVKLLKERDQKLNWICENENKIGLHIYDHLLKGPNHISELIEPQILIAVASPKQQKNIKTDLIANGKTEGKDFWFFL